MIYTIVVLDKKTKKVNFFDKSYNNVLAFLSERNVTKVSPEEEDYPVTANGKMSESDFEVWNNDDERIVIVPQLPVEES